MKAAVLSSLALATLSDALHLPVQRLRPRAPGSTPMSKNSGGSGLTNLQNNLYTAEFIVGETNTTFTLALDTGSSDLWFMMGLGDNNTFASSKIYEPTIERNLSYGTGSVVGNVARLESLEFAGFTIMNQSYLSVTKQDDFFNTLQQQEPQFQGLAGLSFDTLSDINRAVLNVTGDTWGRSLMSNIFLADPSTPNHVAFLLDRTGDLNDTDTGSFDVGTYAPGYEAVADQPKHVVFSGLSDRVIQWNIILSQLTIGGQAQKLESGIKADGTTKIVNAPPAGSLSALFDTGTSAAQIPAEAFKALYESMGGVLINRSPQYAVPCMAEADMVFTFGNETVNQAVSVNHLDLTTIDSLTGGNGQNFTVCKSAYEVGESGGGDNDIILGDAFLRNAYVVYNYGDFVKTESGLTTGSPFIQFLPLTNASAASDEFKQARAKSLASLPPEVDVKTVNDPNPQPASNSSASASGSGTGTGNSNVGSSLGSNLDSLGAGAGSGLSEAQDAELKRLSTLAPIILSLLGACVGLLVILIAVAAAAFSRVKKQGAHGSGGAYMPVALPRERVGEYKDDPHTKYDSQFRD
ncbi:hypothetical protein FRC09_008824 [Ceratobasidium sp. 395]|nr:hypothetical protein FRC09_008824 [Ceratobasidium sp. 395]